MKAKILLVEDQNPYMYELGLQAQNGFEFIVVKRGDHVVQEFIKHKPDLVLVDIRLPMMDGIEVVKQMRKRDLVTPIIVITAFTTKKEQALAAGANAFFTKPTDIIRLYRRIVELLTSTPNQPTDEHIKTLIINKTRRLQALQERRALLGLSSPAELVIEVEDLEIDIAGLKAGMSGGGNG